MKTFLDRIIEYYVKEASLGTLPTEKEDQITSEEPLKKSKFFLNISVGDVILAKRYKTNSERNKNGYGHNIGPYLVIENNGSTIKGIFGTSNKNLYSAVSPKELYTYKHHDENKDTIFILTQTQDIDEYRYLKKLFSFTSEELKHLKDKMNNLKEEKELTPNMLVNYDDETYFVKDVNETYTTLIKLIPGGIKDTVKINGITYQISLDSAEHVFDTKNIEILDIVTEDTSNLINNIYDTKNENRIFKKAKRGDLISFNNSLYYVYGETGNLLNCFLVKNIYEKENRITINGAPYEAKFNEIKDIDTKSLYEICLSATDEEMDYIKDLKKSFSKKSKNELKEYKKPHIAHSNIKAGAIINEKRPLIKEDYIVLRRENCTLYVIKMEDAKKNKFDCIVNMDIRQVYYVGTYDEYQYYELCTGVNQFDNIAITDEYLLELKKLRDNS